MRKTPTLYETAIIDGVLYFEDVPQAEIGSELFVDLLEDTHLKSIRVVSVGMYAKEQVWNGSDYVDIEIKQEMTIRAEKRSGVRHWYAYRRHGGKLQKRYVGQSEKVTAYRLADIARKMM